MDDISLDFVFSVTKHEVIQKYILEYDEMNLKRYNNNNKKYKEICCAVFISLILFIWSELNVCS